MTLTLTAAEVQTLHAWIAAMAAPGLDEQDRRYLAKRVERAAAGIAEPWAEQAQRFINGTPPVWPRLTPAELLGDVPRGR